ncbi:MAG: NAD-dependent epimerase/dehydratase family protein [Deltaproteobacteria bacterium]|nr:NAD-dependent epimerase/dehydratase family protein [Deltaproteobacteria bacterium]
MNADFWTDRPVFVTGATGLLGSHMVQELLARGAAPICLVRDEVGQSLFSRLGLGEHVVVVHGRVEDYGLLERALNEYGIETVIHLAAQAIVGTANRNPLSTWETNVRGTYNLLEACRRNDKTIGRVIVASSDKAYGDQPDLPYLEDASLIGRFPYDCSKSCTDLISRSYFETFGVPVCVTRCGNLFGAGDLNFNRIIPGTIRWALRDEAPIIRSNGKFIRDYVYVGDAVSAYLDLAEQMDRDEVRGEAFNFSDERPQSVVEIVDCVLQAMGRGDLEPKILGQGSHEIVAQYLSSKKARKRLSWRPRFGLEEGLGRTVAWYREFFSHWSAR